MSLWRINLNKEVNHTCAIKQIRQTISTSHYTNIKIVDRLILDMVETHIFLNRIHKSTKVMI